MTGIRAPILQIAFNVSRFTRNEYDEVEEWYKEDYNCNLFFIRN